MSKKKILCIVGASGVGKDFVANAIWQIYGIRPICSYTTRGIRRGEYNGVEHEFISNEKADKLLADKSNILAYTEFGKCRYFALKSQLNDDWNTYIIDEKGLLDLKRNHSDEFDIKSILINSNIDRPGVTESRKKRDDERVEYDDYDAIFYNDYNCFLLKEKCEFVYELSYILSYIF